MNKGVLMQINCMSLEAPLSNKAKHVDTSKAIRVVRKIEKNIKIAQREALMWGPINSKIYGNVVHEILSFVKQKMTLI
jgi:hypothetical protein